MKMIHINENPDFQGYSTAVTFKVMKIIDTKKSKISSISWKFKEFQRDFQHTKNPGGFLSIQTRSLNK